MTNGVTRTCADFGPLSSTPASNIKSRVNRLSVLAAITSTQQRLKLYNRVPTNGLIVYCGTILTDEGKEKKGPLAIYPVFPADPPANHPPP